MPDSENQPENGLQAQNIELGYGQEPVVSDLSTSIRAGEFIGLVGPNGAGKSTLLLALSGQFRPAAGTIHFDGSDIYKKNLDFKQRVGYVHENPFFYPYLSVEEFLHLVARIKEVARDQIDTQVSSVLKSVCLDGECSKATASLSMGMRKKLAIAAALLGSPRLLFMDEALNGIDVESAFRIKQVLREYVKAGGTIILSTHALEVVEKICDRYLILKGGKIIGDLQASVFKEADQVGKSIDLETYVVKLLNS